jgi:hypothetical protein
MIGYLGNDDSTTRQMLGEILAMEEEHAEDSVSLLKELGARFTLGGRKCDSLPSSSRRRGSRPARCPNVHIELSTFMPVKSVDINVTV